METLSPSLSLTLATPASPPPRVKRHIGGGTNGAGGGLGGAVGGRGGDNGALPPFRVGNVAADATPHDPFVSSPIIRAWPSQEMPFNSIIEGSHALDDVAGNICQALPISANLPKPASPHLVPHEFFILRNGSLPAVSYPTTSTPR